MKVKNLIATTILLTSAATLQAQSIVDGAVMYFKLDESVTSVVPVNSISKKAGRYIEPSVPGEVVYDAEYGWVRRSIAGETDMGLYQPMPVSGVSARTISFWAYVDKNYLTPKGTQVVQGAAQVLTVGSPAEKHGNFILLITKGSGLTITTDKQSTHNVHFEGKNELRAAWHHYTVVIEEGGNTSDMRAYVDGVALSAPKTTDAKYNPIESYAINTAKSAGILMPRISGMVADFIVFDRALSVKEIKDLMSATK